MLKRLIFTIQLSATCLGCPPAEPAQVVKSPFEVCVDNAKLNWDLAILSCAEQKKGPKECDTEALTAKRAEEESACFH